jgi:hypothetical protein
MLREAFFILLVLISFLFGILCIRKPEIVFRYLAIWYRSKSGDDTYNNERLINAFRYIDDPVQYHKVLPKDMSGIRSTGRTALIVAVVGLFIVLLGK